VHRSADQHGRGGLKSQRKEEDGSTLDEEV
jgi:hypothetical protein